MNEDEERLPTNAPRETASARTRPSVFDRALAESSLHAIARRRAELEAHYYGIEIDDED